MIFRRATPTLDDCVPEAAISPACDDAARGYESQSRSEKAERQPEAQCKECGTRTAHDVSTRKSGGWARWLPAPSLATGDKVRAQIGWSLSCSLRLADLGSHHGDKQVRDAGGAQL